jgi:four helix bundle protein
MFNPSNIAEGSGKNTNKHFAEFLSISISSSFELETQLLICERRNYGPINKLRDCMESIAEVQKMIFAFRERMLKSETIS